MSGRTYARILAVIVLLVGAACSPRVEDDSARPAATTDATTDDPQCDTGSLPGNFPTTGATDNQPFVDLFSWQSFLYLNTADGGSPLWSDWSSSVDLLEPIVNGSTTTPTPFGTHYYPQECQAISGYQNYRVIDQVDKVNDSLFEAETQGLSGKPLVDSNGDFLRYEILLSEATYDDVADNGYYTPQGQADGVTLICAADSNSGPSDPASGAMNLKLAWMAAPAAGQSADTYYSEELLVYTPAGLTESGEATCELTTLYLVGMHIARKTLDQQAWIWATFEQQNNAPDCTSPPPARNSHQQNTSCPALSSTVYNFMPSSTTCSGGACAGCNSAPASNCSSETGYCVDAAPAASQGRSQLCRQASSYETTTDTTCREQASGTVWANYTLISSQWFVGDGVFPTTCSNSSGKVYVGENVEEASIAPQVALADASETVPYLANTSMESYERSNCMGCHSKAVQAGTTSGPSTDFVYYLMLEVGAESGG